MERASSFTTSQWARIFNQARQWGYSWVFGIKKQVINIKNEQSLWSWITRSKDILFHIFGFPNAPTISMNLINLSLQRVFREVWLSTMFKKHCLPSFVYISFCEHKLTLYHITKFLSSTISKSEFGKRGRNLERRGYISPCCFVQGKGRRIKLLKYIIFVWNKDGKGMTEN